MTYLDVWRSGTFPKKKQQVTECATDHKHGCTTNERSTSDSLGDVSWIQKSALQLYRRNVPLLHTSRYVIAHDSALRLQATNAGVRRESHQILFLVRGELWARDYVVVLLSSLNHTST